MGYTLTIGEALMRYEPDDLYLWIEAERTTHPDAPDHDEYTGKSNSRSPSYSVWSNLCQETGLYELFYGGRTDYKTGHITPSAPHRNDGLITSHPGHAVLGQADLDLVRQARERRQASNGGKEPGFWDASPERPWESIDNGKDPTLARLIWLEFWIDWALKTCKIPIIQNT